MAYSHDTHLPNLLLLECQLILVPNHLFNTAFSFIGCLLKYSRCGFLAVHRITYSVTNRMEKANKICRADPYHNFASYCVYSLLLYHKLGTIYKGVTNPTIVTGFTDFLVHMLPLLQKLKQNIARAQKMACN
jgi:hypothetical protein